MRFFTREWHAGKVSDIEANSASTTYAAHIETLLPKMSATVRALAQSINLHDGRVRKISFDISNRTLIVAMHCGDLQTGYFDVDLVYADVDVRTSDLSEVDAIASDTEAEALYDEVDVSPDGQWIHRVLFWPYREICIVFAKLGLRLEPRENREFRRDA